MRRGKKHRKNIYIHLGKTTNPIAYCALHRSVLSAQQIKSKKCRIKNCYHLKPVRDPFEAAIRRAELYEMSNT